MRHLQGLLSVVALAVSVACVAGAQVPDATSSVGPGFGLPAFIAACPPYIPIAIGGTTGGNVDNCADGICTRFSVVLRNANTGIGGRSVWIDFSNCPDIQISCNQVGGATFVSPKTVVGVSSPTGEFIFDVQGAANAVPLVSGISSGTDVCVPCAQVWADDGSSGQVKIKDPLVVAAYDVNGLGTPTGAVSGADASLVAREVVAVGARKARDDYNASGNVTGADASYSVKMVQQAALGTGTQRTGPYCP